jgi:hypothetical protein
LYGSGGRLRPLTSSARDRARGSLRNADEQNTLLPESHLPILSPLRMPTRRTFAIAALCLTALCCSYDEAIRRFTPPDADANSRAYLALLTRGNTDSAMARLTWQMQDPATRQQVVNIMGILENEHFDSIRVIGANTWASPDARRVNLSYELHSSSGWFEASVATLDSAGDWRVYGLHAHTLAQSLESTQWFTLRGKSMLQYAWLLATLLNPIICLVTAVFVGTRKGMPRRRLWAAMALLGYGMFALNWSTGEWSIATLSVQFLGAGYVRAGQYAPYIFKFSIPLGAAMALERYRRWKVQPTTSPLPAAAV